jgi:hypothetical protein
LSFRSPAGRGVHSSSPRIVAVRRVAEDVKPDAYGHPEGGISLGRFDQLAEVAGTLNDKGPAIAILLKPRLASARYVKQLPHRVVITWDLTEPYGSYLDFTWFKTVNRFQAVLHGNGTINMSYKQVAARCTFSAVRTGAREWLFSAVFQALYASPYRKFESHSLRHLVNVL